MSKELETTENTSTQDCTESVTPSSSESDKITDIEVDCKEKASDDKLWNLALRYARGIGVEKNVWQALEYLDLMEGENRYQEMLRAELYAVGGRIEIARDLYYIHYKLYNNYYSLLDFFKTYVTRHEKIPPKYLEEAVEYFEERKAPQLIQIADFLIGKGYAEGYYFKAVILYNNDYDFVQKQAAYVLELLQTAAEKGYSRGLRLLCAIVSKSQMSPEEKLRMFKYASESGEADGAYYYAELFETIKQTASNENSEKIPNSQPPQGLSFTDAEQRGSIPALYRLALNLRKNGAKQQPEKYFQALKVVVESKRWEFAFSPVIARYFLAEAYQYGIGTKKDLDESDVWYETISWNPYAFLNWLKNESDKERKMILLNLFNHDKRYRLHSRPRPTFLPEWLKRFDEKLWQEYIAEDARYWRGLAYVEEAEKYPENKMPRKKVKALKRALRLGNGKACDVIEKYYCLNEMKESPERIKNLKRGVKLNNPCCMFYLGNYLIKSEDFKTQAEGVRLTRAAANRGVDFSPVKNLSLYYEHGTGVKKDLKKYLELMIECFDDGNIQFYENSEKILTGFCFAIGYFYDMGEGEERDVRKAILWFRRGADYGEPYCMKILGDINYNKEYGRKSYALSRRWWEKTAIKGWEFGNIQNTLGYFYHYGSEGRQDFFKAIKYYRLAYSLCVSKKDPDSVVEARRAAYNLGVIYSQELRDFENAIVWYKKSLAVEESLSTFNNLATCYTDLDNPDFEAAETIYNRILKIAPKHSYVIGYAYSNLADLALERSAKTGKIDYEKARKLKARSVEELEATIKLYESGDEVDFNDSVYYNLANIYLNSELLDHNLEKARLYAVKGAKLGNYNACELCKKNGFKY